MSTTLSLRASIKIIELLGGLHGTRLCHYDIGTGDWNVGDWREAVNAGMAATGSTSPGYGVQTVCAPDFLETIRLLPKIAEKKGWPWVSNCEGKLTLEKVAEECLWTFMKAPTEEKGMGEVSEHLEKIL